MKKSLATLVASAFLGACAGTDIHLLSPTEHHLTFLSPAQIEEEVNNAKELLYLKAPNLLMLTNEAKSIYAACYYSDHADDCERLIIFETSELLQGKDGPSPIRSQILEVRIRMQNPPPRISHSPIYLYLVYDENKDTFETVISPIKGQNSSLRWMHP